MSQHRNTLDHIASEKIARNALSVAHLASQVAVHVEYSGTSIHGNERETQYIIRCVPGKEALEQCTVCHSRDTYSVYSYLTRIYMRCNACGEEICNVEFHSKTTRALQWQIAHAYPGYMQRLTEKIAEEREYARKERNRRARDRRKNTPRPVYTPRQASYSIHREIDNLLQSIEL